MLPFLLFTCLSGCSPPSAKPPVVAFAEPHFAQPAARPDTEPPRDIPDILAEARRLEIEADEYVISPVSTSDEIGRLGQLTQVMKVDVGRLVLSAAPSPALFRRARQSVETLRAYLQSRKRPIE